MQVRAGEVRGAGRGAGRPPVPAVQPPVRALRRHAHALQHPVDPGRQSFKRRFAKISQSGKTPLLGPSPG